MRIFLRSVAMRTGRTGFLDEHIEQMTVALVGETPNGRRRGRMSQSR